MSLEILVSPEILVSLIKIKISNYFKKQRIVSKNSQWRIKLRERLGCSHFFAFTNKHFSQFQIFHISALFANSDKGSHRIGHHCSFTNPLTQKGCFCCVRKVEPKPQVCHCKIKYWRLAPTMKIAQRITW